MFLLKKAKIWAQRLLKQYSPQLKGSHCTRRLPLEVEEGTEMSRNIVCRVQVQGQVDNITNTGEEDQRFERMTRIAKKGGGLPLQPGAGAGGE